MAQSKKKVLVTGHDGYVGAVVVQSLLDAGCEVVGLDTYYFEDCQFSNQSAQAASIPTIKKDLRDMKPEDVAGFDAVIHLAGLSNDPLGQLEPNLTIDLNFHATESLAKAAKAAGVAKFLYASSCSLYGKSDEDWMTEASATAPLTAYAKSKVLSEDALNQLASSDFSPIILRCATVFGASPKLRIDLVVNNLTAWGVTTGKIKIMSDGSPWRPLIHVEDLANAYLYFLNCNPAELTERTFNVGFNTHNYQVCTIANQVAAALPGTQVEFANQPDKDSRSYRVEFSRYEKTTQLKPLYDLQKGIEQLVDAYRTQGLTEAEFLGRKYIRLNQMNHLLETGRVDTYLRWQLAVESVS